MPRPTQIRKSDHGKTISIVISDEDHEVIDECLARLERKAGFTSRSSVVRRLIRLGASELLGRRLRDD